MTDAMCADRWTVEGAIPPQVLEQIEAIRQSSSLTDPASGSPNTSITGLFAFLHIVRQLKVTPRTGWLNHDISKPGMPFSIMIFLIPTNTKFLALVESISDHMYRMGIISMLSTDPTLDTNRCVKLALVHDMAESIVGDITPADIHISKSEKHRREYETMKYLTGPTLLAAFNQSAANEIMDLWEEYENISSSEARFVKDVDKFELIFQTLEYEREFQGQKDLSVFLSVREQIKSQQVSEWADAAIAFREESWASLNKK